MVKAKRDDCAYALRLPPRTLSSDDVRLSVGQRQGGAHERALSRSDRPDMIGQMVVVGSQRDRAIDTESEGMSSDSNRDVMAGNG